LPEQQSLLFKHVFNQLGIQFDVMTFVCFFILSLQTPKAHFPSLLSQKPEQQSSLLRHVFAQIGEQPAIRGGFKTSFVLHIPKCKLLFVLSQKPEQHSIFFKHQLARSGRQPTIVLVLLIRFVLSTPFVTLKQRLFIKSKLTNK